MHSGNQSFSRPEPEFEDIQAALSAPPQEETRAAMARRTFLKMIGAGVGLSMMPDWLVESAWAGPLQPHEGILVVIQMGGGNDGLNMVVPDVAKYYDLRKQLAVSAASTLDIGPGVGLHPALSKLKSRYDQGKVAVVQGVGWGNNDLSHFDCTANWMSGWAPVAAPNASLLTGWLGRYLDEFGEDPLNGVNIGTQIPLHLTGARTRAAALPTSKGSLLFGGGVPSNTDQRLFTALRAMGSKPTGLGPVADMIAETEAKSIDVNNQVLPCFSESFVSGPLAPQLQLVARLINANVGSRVYGVSWGSFDHHENAGWQHEQKMAELDAAIDAFYTTLQAAYGSQVTLMTFSEFGRRPNMNGSYGTDHGTSSPLFVIGDRVRGGLYGEQPSLTDLDTHGNLKTKVDFHQIYATILDKWLDADSAELLGGTYTAVDLFTGPPLGPSVGAPSTGGGMTGAPAPAPPPIPSDRPISYPRAYRIVTAAGVVKSYGGADTYGSAPSNEKIAALAVTPDQRGYWMTSVNGGVFAYGNAPFHGSANTLRLNAPIVGMSSTATGNGYWLLGRDGGIFSYGDAAFYGSTGSMKLNQPVVGMAATPRGNGYWLVASDGGIFAFGNAQFFGSTGSMRLNQPIVGMASTPDGGGYWLVASDGGIFAYGNAGFHGSMGGKPLNKPIVSMASTPTGLGYRLVASDGGVFCFGDATFEGSTGANGSGSPVIGIIV
jgi:uncharacterized protein (DUF1501 family)